jgi:DNA mismatch repair ATPase MutL
LNFNFNELLRIWVSQLLDNALDCNPELISLTFHQYGTFGFTLSDNGTGYTTADLSVIARCLPQRERNEMYKTRSIGFRGEALSSLCKCAKVSIITKHKEDGTPVKVTYTARGEV